jgi:hypothetical protein
MDEDRYLADYQEPSNKLTDRQRKLVDEYMIDLNKAGAFRRAGYTCSNPDKLSLYVNRAFRSEAVKAEIRKRQEENSIACIRMSPLDLMLENMAFYHKLATDPKAKLSDQIALRGLAEKCAVDAAPFIHPRLQAIAHLHQMKRSIDDFTDDELQVIALQSEIVNGSGSDGDGTPDFAPEGTRPQ